MWRRKTARIFLQYLKIYAWKYRVATCSVHCGKVQLCGEASHCCTEGVQYIALLDTPSPTTMSTSTTTRHHMICSYYSNC